MSRPISLFSGYDQAENRATNYTTLLLKMLYEASPAFLGDALDALTGGALAGRVGVRFSQQQRFARSVPDAVIAQSAFTLFVETKTSDWFYDDQLRRHLEGLRDLPGDKVLVALSNFEDDQPNRFEHLESSDLKIVATSFETFADALLNLPGLPRPLLDTVQEYRAYLDESGFLPRWRTQLDACNCAGKREEQMEHGTYLCPASGGAYSHTRSRFFGAYWDKAVRLIADLRAIVVVDVDGGGSVQFANVDTPHDDLVQEALGKKAATRPDIDYAVRVFLLGPLHKTDFQKDTPRGMMGSKQYFDLDAYGLADVKDAAELAERLRGKAWQADRRG